MKIKFNKKPFLILTGTVVTTVNAKDGDSYENNKMFDLRIVSVFPKPQDLEFYITQNPGSQTGTLSFKGCLDHEVRGVIT